MSRQISMKSLPGAGSNLHLLYNTPIILLDGRMSAPSNKTTRVTSLNLLWLPEETLHHIISFLDLGSMARLHTTSLTTHTLVCNSLVNLRTYRHKTHPGDDVDIVGGRSFSTWFPRTVPPEHSLTFRRDTFEVYNSREVNGPVHFLARHTKNLTFLELTTDHSDACHLNHFVLKELLENNKKLKFLDITGTNIMLDTARMLKEHGILSTKQETGCIQREHTEFFYDFHKCYLINIRRTDKTFIKFN